MAEHTCPCVISAICWVRMSVGKSHKDRLCDAERQARKYECTLQDGKAFVGVRAFEQLGYTVTYTPQEDEKMVEIMK